MPHLPFEEWLFAEEALSASQQQALLDHLANCPGCRQLARHRDESEAGLREMAVVQPPRDFLERWGRARRQRLVKIQLWHVWLVLGLCTIGTLTLAAILGWQLAFVAPSPVRLVMEAIRLAASLISDLREAQVVGTVLVEGAGDFLPLSVWVGLLVSLGLLSTLWVHVLLRLNAQGARK